MKELYREGEISIGVEDEMQFYVGVWKKGKDKDGNPKPEELEITAHLQTLWRAIRCAANKMAKRKALRNEVDSLQDFMQELLAFERRVKEMTSGV